MILLEARDRIGGRIFTSSKWSDAKVDLGAIWIHGDDQSNPVAQLARDIGARLTTTDFDNDLSFDTDGTELNANAMNWIESHTVWQAAQEITWLNQG